MTKDEIIKELKYLSRVYQKRQASPTPNWRQEVWIFNMLAEAAGMIESFDKRAIINEFISKVEELAEEKMLKTGKLEGAHYAALIQLQREMNDE